MNRDEKGRFIKGNTVNQIYDEDLLDQLADHLFAWIRKKKIGNKFALLSDWCFEVGLNPRNFGKYSKRSKKFEQAYHWAKDYQALSISRGALQNKLNPRFAQFFLAVNHNWIIHKDISEEEKQKSNLEAISEYIHEKHKGKTQ